VKLENNFEFKANRQSGHFVYTA